MAMRLKNRLCYKQIVCAFVIGVIYSEINMFSYLFSLVFMRSFYVVPALTVEDPGKFRIKLNYVEVNGRTINVIERTSMRLECVFKENTNGLVRWDYKTERGDSTVTGNNVLVINTIQRTQSGTEYKCHNYDAIESYKAIRINVQYPPATPRISGPSTVSKHARFNLTCIADSEPQAIVWWTSAALANVPKVSENSTVTIEATTDDEIVLYCLAYNIMYPTNGEPVRSNVVRAEHRVQVQGQTMQKITTSHTTVNTNTEITEDNQTGWFKVVVALSVTGCLVASVAVAVILCCRNRKRGRNEETQDSVFDRRTEASSNLYAVAPSCSHDSAYTPYRRLLTPEEGHAFHFREEETQDSTIDRRTEALRNLYAVPTSCPNDSACTPYRRLSTPEEGHAFHFHGTVHAANSCMKAEQRTMSLNGAKWREKNEASHVTRKPCTSIERNYMNLPVIDMASSDDHVIPSQKTKLIIETTHM